MIEGVMIKKIEKNVDARGWLAEIWRGDEAAYRPAMSYVSVTKPGVIRGPHEHKEQSDAFVFVGPGNFQLHLWDGRSGSPTKGEYFKLEVGAGDPVMIIVPPGVVHGYKCVGPADGWCVNLPDKLYRGEGKSEEADEVRWENDPEGKYKIS